MSRVSDQEREELAEALWPGDRGAAESPQGQMVMESLLFVVERIVLAHVVKAVKATSPHAAHLAAQRPTSAPTEES